MHLNEEDAELVRQCAQHFGQDEQAMVRMLLRLGAQQMAPQLTPEVVNQMAARARQLDVRNEIHPQQQATLIQVGANKREIEWRVSEVWRCHLAQRKLHYETKSGRTRSTQPKLTSDNKREIIRCLKEFDGDLLEPHLREQWKRESITRAAGMGIFLSAHHNGDNRDGKEWLEPWRPWKRRPNAGEQTQTFADLYFEARDLHEIE